MGEKIKKEKNYWWLAYWCFLDLFVLGIIVFSILLFLFLKKSEVIMQAGNIWTLLIIMIATLSALFYIIRLYKQGKEKAIIFSYGYLTLMAGSMIINYDNSNVLAILVLIYLFRVVYKAGKGKNRTILK